MRKLAIWGVLALMALAIAAVPALAAKPGTGSTSGNPHYVGAAPTINISGNTATVSSGAKVAGIGSEPVTFLLTVSGFVTTQCTNPAGNVAPGQNSSFTVSGEPVVVTPDQTGTLTVPEGISASGPAVGDPVSNRDAGCPNRQWSGSVTSSTITSATLTVSQGGSVIPALTVTAP
jgi:hypothetical protein